MPFADSTRTYSETRKRTSDSYVKFSENHRVVLRILNGNAKLVWKHWIQEANGGKGMMAVCPNITAQTNACPIEKSLAGLEKTDPRVLERRAKSRYMVNVLDRTPVTVCNSCNTVTPAVTPSTGSGKVCTNCGADVKKNEFVPLNKVKLLEQGPRLFKETLNGVEKLQKEDFDKEITEYDIVFTTQGNGRDRRIQAIPQNPEELDESWLIDPETSEPQKLFNLDDLAEPTSIEEIEAMLKGATMEELNAIRGIV
jgi:hypothetical protein